MKSHLPSDILDVVNAMGVSSRPTIVGSASDRTLKYFGDVDLVETSHFTSSKQLAGDIQRLVKRLLSMGMIRFDSKIGEVEDWKFASEPGAWISKTESIRRLTRIDWLTPLQKGEILLTLEEDPNPSDLLRFHIIRWSIPEILAGVKKLPDGRYLTLEKSVELPGMIKFDATFFIPSLDRFIEFSNILTPLGIKSVSRPSQSDILESLESDFRKQLKAENYFKALKRTASWRAAKGLSNSKLTAFFNSKAGAAHQFDTEVELFRLMEPSLTRLQKDAVEKRLAKLKDASSDSANSMAKSFIDENMLLLPNMASRKSKDGGFLEMLPFIGGPLHALTGLGKPSPSTDVGAPYAGGLMSGGKKKAHSLGARYGKVLARNHPELMGSGFFDSFLDGLKSVASIAKPVLAAIPHPYAQGAAGVLNALGAGKPSPSTDVGAPYAGGASMDGGLQTGSAKPKRKVSERTKVRGMLQSALMKGLGCKMGQASHIIKEKSLMDHIESRMGDGMSPSEAISELMSAMK